MRYPTIQRDENMEARPVLATDMPSAEAIEVSAIPAQNQIRLYPPKKARQSKLREDVKQHFASFMRTSDEIRAQDNVKKIEDVKQSIEYYKGLVEQKDALRESAIRIAIERCEQNNKNFLENISSYTQQLEMIIPAQGSIQQLDSQLALRLQNEIAIMRRMPTVDSVSFKTGARSSYVEIKTTNIQTAPTVRIEDNAIAVPVITLPRLCIRMDVRGYAYIHARDEDGRAYNIPFIDSNGNKLGKVYSRLCLGNAGSDYADAIRRGRYALAYTIILQILRSVMNSTSGYSRAYTMMAVNKDVEISYPDITEGDAVIVKNLDLWSSNISIIAGAVTDAIGTVIASRGDGVLSVKVDEGEYEWQTFYVFNNHHFITRA